VLLNLEGDGGSKNSRRNFGYEIMWERESSLTDDIHSEWNVGVQVQSLGDISDSLRRVGKALSRWSHEKFGSVTKELASLRAKIEELSSQNQDANQNELQRL
jgi:hypothetical protein